MVCAGEVVDDLHLVELHELAELDIVHIYNIV